MVLGGGVLYMLTKNLTDESAQLITNNQELQENIESSSNDLAEAKILQAKLANISTLLKNHINATPLLDELESFTYIRSQYVNVSFEEEGKMHLEGNVSSYSDLGKLLLGLSTSEYFEDVRLLSVSVGSESETYYRFSISMIASEKLFINKE